jgi:hypothetical protein
MQLFRVLRYFICPAFEYLHEHFFLLKQMIRHSEINQESNNMVEAVMMMSEMAKKN